MKYKYTGKISTVELFAGIGGFRIAADRCGSQTVWANDNDPKACAVYRDRFGGNELYEGDIQRLLGEIPEHNLLTAGFPCQPFSSAGKKEGIRDSRGTLFQIIVRVLRRHKPEFFVLENVKRLLSMESGSHFATILQSLAKLDYHVEWRLLNAAHFGLPQNRQRVFVIGIKRPENISTDVRTISLGTAEDFIGVTPAQYDHFADFGRWKNIQDHAKRFPNWGVAKKGRFFGLNLDTFADGKRPAKLKSVLETDVSGTFDFTEETLERLRTSTLVNRFVDGVQILSNQNGGARMGYTVFGTGGIAPTLTRTTSRHYERYQIGDKYRRLTNVEYARIQGFPDDHCQAASIYDQYALYGNAVPPPMAEWVIERTIEKNSIIMQEPSTLFNYA